MNVTQSVRFILRFPLERKFSLEKELFISFYMALWIIAKPDTCIWGKGQKIYEKVKNGDGCLRS